MNLCAFQTGTKSVLAACGMRHVLDCGTDDELVGETAASLAFSNAQSA